MNARLKELYNNELATDGQPLVDCGDEWTELVERVDEIRCREARLDALREVLEMMRQWHANTVNEMLRKDSARIMANIVAMIEREAK